MPVRFTRPRPANSCSRERVSQQPHSTIFVRCLTHTPRHLQSLEDRLEAIESVIRQQNGDVKQSDHAPTTSTNLRTPNSHNHFDGESSVDGRSFTFHNHQETRIGPGQLAVSRPDAVTAETEETLDGLGLGSETFAEEENKAFFGKLSYFRLLKLNLTRLRLLVQHCFHNRAVSHPEAPLPEKCIFSVQLLYCNPNPPLSRLSSTKHF